MNIEDQFELEHLLFEQRKCKICGETKELINDFYKTRKDRGNVPSAYACLLYTSPSPRDPKTSRMPSSA